MLLDGRRESDNMEYGSSGGGGRRMLFGGGIGAAVLGLIVYLLGGDPSQVLNQGSGPASQPTEQTQSTGPRDATESLMAKVLGSTEDVWQNIFQKKYNQSYERPKFQSFDQTTETGCGMASSDSGPFYCPLDRKLYMDRSFVAELRDRFKAPGDFAVAYVIAHEVGHHVQNLLGISDKVQQARQQAGEAESNALSVRLELQADFLAGVWAHDAQNMQGIVQPGDIEEALNAAAAVGDDRIQAQARGYVEPESFTHGSAQQRMYWFKRGYETGDIDQGNTFAADL